MASSREADRPPDIVALPTLDPGTRATLHRPSGLMIIGSGVNSVSGLREELLRLAAEIIAADWEATQYQKYLNSKQY